MGDGDLGKMKGQAIALGALAGVVLVSSAVVGEYSNSGVLGNCTTGGNLTLNPFPSACTAATNFQTGLAIFGTFTAVLALAIVGKAVIGLFGKGK